MHLFLFFYFLPILCNRIKKKWNVDFFHYDMMPIVADVSNYIFQIGHFASIPKHLPTAVYNR